jgi:hypothetical protein
VYTPCIKVTRFNVDVRYMRLRAMYHRHVRRMKPSGPRVSDTGMLLKQVDAALKQASITEGDRVRSRATARDSELAR